jgi:hypothetical protein
MSGSPIRQSARFIVSMHRRLGQTLHEICDDRLYLLAGVSISAGDVVLAEGR